MEKGFKGFYKLVTCALLGVYVLSFNCARANEIQREMDSLRQVLNETPINDHEKLTDIHLHMSWNMRDVHPDSSLYFASIALRLAEGNGLIHRKIEATNYLGIAYRNLSNYTKAFEKYLEALSLAEKESNKEQLGYALLNLGNLYLFQTNFNGAIRYFVQALDVAQMLADSRMTAYCYLNLGRSYMGVEEYGQAERYFKQAIEIRQTQDDVYGLIAAEIDLANVYLKKGEIDRSYDYYMSLIKRINAYENPRSLCLVHSSLAKIYIIRNQLKQAEENAFKALTIARSITSRFDEKNILETLSQIYANGGNYDKAYEYQVEYAEVNQQLFSEENIRKIEHMKSQHLIEKKDAENQFLRKHSELDEEIIFRQRVIIILSVIGMGLLLLLMFISLRALQVRNRLNNKISKQRDKIQSDKDIIAFQASRLEELNEVKSRFFANVSHDLRTPLSLIYGNIEMLMEDQETLLSLSGKRNLDIGLKNCKRLLYLTDEINDLTKLEEGKIVLKKEVVNIGSYLKMLSEMFVATAQSKGLSLSYKNNLSSQDNALLDPRQFEKIFYNLVSNSIRYTKKGGSIIIRTRKNLSKIIIEISDTGEGIPSESLPYIFDRFYQAKNSPHRSREGLGIGLALVRDLVELHEGEINVQSAVGMGTTFTLSFFATKEQGLDQTGDLIKQMQERKHLYSDLDGEFEAGVSLPKLDKDKKSILLVDDHPEIRFHIKQILEDGYHIIEAAHGLEALELMKTSKVDLIVSDLMMPWMDGFELIEAINANEAYSKIPVLVVSARISEADQEKVLYHGVNDYLKKPFNKKELVLRINNLLQQKEKWEAGGEIPGFPNKEHLPVFEKDILTKVESLVMDRIDDISLSVYDLADAIAASERQVYRMVKKMTGLTPYEYITEIRIKYADYLIRKHKVKNATEAAKSVGIKNVTSFNKQYEKKFGVKPTEILNA